MTTVGQIRAPRSVRAQPPALAALDLGTNNCRLLVARPQAESFIVIDSFSRIVRLGEGLALTGVLGDRAMARTLAALRVCARIMLRHHVTAARCVATEACRQAANGADFLDMVERDTGLVLEVLPHEHEAELALLGCLPLVDPDAEHVLMVDIGGGSTELLWLDVTRPGAPWVRCSVSLPFGVVTLTDAFTAEPDERTYGTMIDHVLRRLDRIETIHHLRSAFTCGRVQLLGTSGTVTTLAAVLLDLPRYDRRRIDGLSVEIDAIVEVSERLRHMSNRSRAAHPCIGTGRADLVVAGSAILEAILHSWPVDTLRVADRGLREGILHGLMGRSLDQSMQMLGTGRQRAAAYASC